MFLYKWQILILLKLTDAHSTDEDCLLYSYDVICSLFFTLFYYVYNVKNCLSALCSLDHLLVKTDWIAGVHRANKLEFYLKWLFYNLVIFFILSWGGNHLYYISCLISYKAHYVMMIKCYQKWRMGEGEEGQIRRWTGKGNERPVYQFMWGMRLDHLVDWIEKICLPQTCPIWICKTIFICYSW